MFSTLTSSLIPPLPYRMDIDLPAGGDSCRKRVDNGASAEGTMDIVPLEMYDSARAKIAANLRWLFAKAYGIGKGFYPTCMRLTWTHWF